MAGFIISATQLHKKQNLPLSQFLPLFSNFKITHTTNHGKNMVNYVKIIVNYGKNMVAKSKTLREI